MIEYFKIKRPPMPQWLIDYEPNDQIDIKEILKHPFLYYPGSFIDGEPLRKFNIAHALHTYIYVDYGHNFERVKKEFNDDSFVGYNLLHIEDFDLKRAVPSPSGHTHAIKFARLRAGKMIIDKIPSFSFIAIFTRKETYDESHGASRFALIYLGYDAVEMYDYLFSENIKPYIVVLQDHGFGLNYTTFGKGGLLEEIVRGKNAFPLYTYVATTSTTPWSNYVLVNNIVYNENDYLNPKRKLFKYKTI